MEEMKTLFATLLLFVSVSFCGTEWTKPFSPIKPALYPFLTGYALVVYSPENIYTEGGSPFTNPQGSAFSGVTYSTADAGGSLTYANSMLAMILSASATGKKVSVLVNTSINDNTRFFGVKIVE
jgi:hypothetical protein